MPRLTRDDKRARSTIRRRRRWLVLVSSGPVLFSGAGWAWWADRSYRSAIMAIELEMANGRFGIAARELNQTPGTRSRRRARPRFCWDGVNRNAADSKAAAEALARVAPGSELSHKAILARMRLFHDQGQFAAAEQLINEAALDPRNDERPRASAARADLQPARPPRRSASASSRRGGNELNDRAKARPSGPSTRSACTSSLHSSPTRSNRFATYLDQAYQLAPDDDRVWLGRANLAIRTGDYKEAEALARCVPEAPPRRCPGLVRLAQPRDRIQPDRPRASRP